MHWRELIHQYLIACQQDGRAATKAARREQQIVLLHGTDELNRRNDEIQQSHAERMPVSPPDTYILVDESGDRIIAEIDDVPNGYPAIKSRFSLVREGDSWLLDDVLWECCCDHGKCFSCDDGNCSICSGGKCMMCHGSGSYSVWLILRRKCLLCEGTGSCNICEGNGLCNHCKGTARCTMCAGSTLPGWTSRFSNLPESPKDQARS